TPVSVRSGATNIQEQGTQTCPFAPMLQSIASDGSSATVALRSWHGQPVVIETSTDLQNWAPIYTNAMALPRFEYRHGNAMEGWRFEDASQDYGPPCGVGWDPQAMADPRRFYRAVQP
ncbi:MAG: hypothetical protein L0Y58_23170, partial [Verrucomicrobia subdivision 3 bacterium]|nr:hypothetical protein [Limisphaerales bacterium]